MIVLALGNALHQDSDIAYGSGDGLRGSYLYYLKGFHFTNVRARCPAMSDVLAHSLPSINGFGQTMTTALAFYFVFKDPSDAMQPLVVLPDVVGQESPIVPTAPQRSL